MPLRQQGVALEFAGGPRRGIVQLEIYLRTVHPERMNNDDQLLLIKWESPEKRISTTALR